MKRKIRTPYFEIGTKNYVYGDLLLEYAKAADAAAEQYDIDVLFIAPAVEIRRVAENTRNLILIAPYMDTLRPGRGMADILPEGLKAAGAQGVVINHCEKPMSLPAMKATIDRARGIGFPRLCLRGYRCRGAGHCALTSGYHQSGTVGIDRRCRWRRERYGLCARSDPRD